MPAQHVLEKKKKHQHCNAYIRTNIHALARQAAGESSVSSLRLPQQCPYIYVGLEHTVLS
jgi:hypothetical protein